MEKSGETQTMNFFQHQEKARKKTSLLIFLFICAVLAIFLAIHTLVAYLVSFANEEAPLMWFWLDPKLLLYDFGAVLLVVGGGSLFKILALSSLQGDGIALQLGGKRIYPGTKVLRERRLLNIVEEMAIASGIHVPNVYLLENEPSINAFAAGFTPNTSVVAVTDGALNYLNRDELQGVIAHEFSHILNGDTKINLRLIGILYGLEMIVILGMVICRSLYLVSFTRSNNSEDNKGSGALILLGIFLFGLAITIIGSIGLFFSNLIRAAVSRQREFLADASAVQFTRNPKGIGGALTKIGCPNIGSHIDNTRSVESCHLFIGSVFTRGFFTSLFDSHPNLAERIHRIDPSFNGTFPIQVLPVDQESDYKTNRQESSAFTYNLAQDSPLTQNMSSDLFQPGVQSPHLPFENTGTPDGPPVIPVTREAQNGPSPSNTSPNTSNAGTGENRAKDFAQSIGSMRENQLNVAEALLESIPDDVRNIARQLVSARFAIYSLLMVDYLQASPRTRFDEAVWTMPVLQKQWNYLCSQLTVNEQNLFRSVIETIKGISVSSRISVVELTIPVLKTMNKENYRLFRNNAIELIKADNSVDLFEYTLQHYLIRNLDVYYRLTPPPQVKYKRFEAVREYFRQALSYLAYEGNDNEYEIQTAFNAATASLGTNLNISPLSECSPATFGRSLNELAFAAPALKQILMTGFYHCVTNDGVITDKEGDLIRAICAALDLPMPHWRIPV